MTRRLPVGAEVLPDGTVHARVWAPARRTVEAVIEPEGRAVALEREDGGHFSGPLPGARAGTRYRYRLDGHGDLLPDPASRFQPEGPHGPSEVVDPRAFRWTDGGWRGVRLPGQVLYELHVGTFTRQGTFRALTGELEYLRDLGVTLLELMPVNECDGDFGWGYDGVDLFAPWHRYGTPDDLRAVVDRAHALGLGVVLDVVYNHLGPSGNYLPRFSGTWFSSRHHTDWGEALNYDGEGSAGVREFVVANARHWIGEYHLDGLRLDATQDVQDDSPEHVLAELTRAAREAAGERSILVFAENEPQDTRLVRELGIDGMWNDDLHHAARVAVTGKDEAYFTDYRGTPQELVSAARRGYLYQGQHYLWQGKRRGTSTAGLPAATFVSYLQNHDQVSNTGLGHRIHVLTSPGRLRAVTAYLLLAPGTPLLFMGQECAASARWTFFAGHRGELGRLVREGRVDFMSQFRSARDPAMVAAFGDPGDPATVEACRLDPGDRVRNRATVDLHRDLLRLRREDPAFAAQDASRLEGAVLGQEAFVLRFAAGEERLLVVNLGRALLLEAAPEPLLAPPAGHGWGVLWSSEDPRYGGEGTFPPERRTPPPHPEKLSWETTTSPLWRLPGHAALVLRPEPETDDRA